MKQLHLQNEVGKKGEQLACMFLVKQGFRIKIRNYLKKWGEIDIVAEKSGKLHFVEVKAVSRENILNVNRETDSYRPEDNIHQAKLQRLSRVIQSYLIEETGEGEPDWQFDIITVYLSLKTGESHVEFLEDIIL